MAQANAEQRDLRAQLADDIQRQARVYREAGPGRDHDSFRRQTADLVDRDFVIAMHSQVRAQLAQFLHHVISEAIVIVDH